MLYILNNRKNCTEASTTNAVMATSLYKMMGYLIEIEIQNFCNRMNMWTPQTGKNGDGWQYTYAAEKIAGFKQTHQPSPWMNDYGMFSIMPVTGKLKFDEKERASWFSHKAETATPYYYSVYLADAD